MYCWPQSDILVKSYGRLNFSWASFFNFERLDILWSTIEVSVKSYGRLNLSELPISILSVSKYYGLQCKIRVKSYSCLNLPDDSLFNFECLDILWTPIEHPSQNLQSFEFIWGFRFQFQASRNIMVRIRVLSQMLWLFEFAQSFHV